MTFRIDHGKAVFLISDPSGNDSRVRHYGEWATLDYNDRTYGAYLSGEINEETDEPTDATGEPSSVYDITDFPAMVKMDTTLEEVYFDGEMNSKGVSLDGFKEVLCQQCAGDGFFYEKIPGWIAPPPEDDEEDEDDEEAETIEGTPL